MNEKNVKMVSCLAVLVIGLSGCSRTLEGAKTDIFDTRKAISDFVAPSSKPVEVEKKID